MNVLVVAAHPDDETLGCGGTLLKHRNSGSSLDWLITSRGLAQDWPADVLDSRRKEIAAVAREFDFRHVIQLDFPAARLDTVPRLELLAAMRKAIERSAPQVVYVVHPGDINSDHRVVFESVAAVLKPFHCLRIGVRRILAYETFSSTDQAPGVGYAPFTPTVFSDISPWMGKKLDIMDLYTTQLQDKYMPRTRGSISAQGRTRGATIGVEYAEAFHLIHETF